MPFVSSVLAMLCWSGSDFFTKLGTSQEDKRSELKVGGIVGLIFGLHALYMLIFGGVTISLSDLIFYLPASILYIGSMLIGYMGLRYIELSISSPICNSSGALALLFSLLYFGVTFAEGDESGKIFLNAPIIIGAVFVAAGVIALGLVDYSEDDVARAARQEKSSRKYARSLLAILLPILYCVLDAAGTFVDTLLADAYTERLLDADPLLDPDLADSITGDRLNTAYELTWLLVGIVCLVIVYLVRRSRPKVKEELPIALGGICETAGQVFYMAVVVSEYKVGLVIISAYCAVSLLWSAIFLKERLSWKHYAAIAAAFVGIVILGWMDV